MVEKNRPMKRPVKIIIITIVAGLALSMLIPRTRDCLDLYMQKKDLQAQIDSLESRRQQLQEEKGAMNDPEMIERVAREQLGMIKVGEKVMVEMESP